MDLLRRNTDYALRAMVNLAESWQDRPVSTRDLAAAEGISYELACKLLQKLAGRKLVKSTMGPKGGFELSRSPDKISLAEVIKSVQGPLNLNRCLLPDYKCPKERTCSVRKKLTVLQDCIDDYLEQITLDDLVKTNGKRTGRKAKK